MSPNNLVFCGMLCALCGVKPPRVLQLDKQYQLLCSKNKIQQKQVLSERKDDGYKNFEFFLVRRVVTREINSGAKMG